MDQVVDRFIEREHALMKALSTRTPVVETYLQNLTRIRNWVPVPSADSLFLGRMDMGEQVDRKDYLKEQDKGMETRLMGGFNKLFKVQYQPLGFSWMVYADRTDFDREHYDFITFAANSWRCSLPGVRRPAEEGLGPGTIPRARGRRIRITISSG